jgi:hypothetical protein
MRHEVEAGLEAQKPVQAGLQEKQVAEREASNLQKQGEALKATAEAEASVFFAEVVACSTRQCLDAWRAKKEADMKKYTPKEYQHFAKASIEKEYRKNRARIEEAAAASKTDSSLATDNDKSGKIVDLLASLPPAFFAEVAACSTRQCLDAWRAKTEADMKKYTPSEYQHFAMTKIEKEYRKSRARIEDAAAANRTDSSSSKAQPKLRGSPLKVATVLESDASATTEIKMWQMHPLAVFAGILVFMSIAGAFFAFRKQAVRQDSGLDGKYSMLLAA